MAKTKVKKSRLFDLLLQRGLAKSAEESRGLILAGRILVNGEKLDKEGAECRCDAVVEVLYKCPYVGRGALKLAAAFGNFQLNLQGKVCADVGSSTGGFTEVLLEQQASKVYSIDTAEGELAWKLRQDPRVIVMEGVNACYLETLPEPVSFVSIDISLMPLRSVLPAVKRWLNSNGEVVALVKPQYEADRKDLPEGAIVNDSALHAHLLARLIEWVPSIGLYPRDIISSPLPGKGGNREFLLWLQIAERSSQSLTEKIAAVTGLVLV